MRPGLEIHGLKEMNKLVRRAQDSEVDAAIKKLNKSAAEVVVADAAPHAPRKSGALAASVKATNTKAYAAVKAGSAKRVPYAGPIHYGWGRRNIRPQPWLMVGVAKKANEISDLYEKGLLEVLAVLESKGLQK